MTTLLDKWKELAKIENMRMLETQWGGRAPNYGVAPGPGNSTGLPRMSEISRSKPAKELLRLAQQGYSIAEAARFTATPVETVMQRCARYQIKFKDSRSDKIAK